MNMNKTNCIMVGNKVDNKFYGDNSEQGFIFKDENAFHNDREAICYIAEAGFNGKDFLTQEEANAEIETAGASTHNSIFNEVKEYLIDEFGKHKITDEFVEYCCECIFQMCDWQCFTTALYELDLEEDLLWYVVDRAKKREDWNKEWEEQCLYEFLKEKIYNSSNHDWDMIIDEFVNLSNN